MFYTMDEVKHAIDKGFIVKWKNEGYTAFKDSTGRYLVGFYGRDYVGLDSHSDPESFYITGQHKGTDNA